MVTRDTLRCGECECIKCHNETEVRAVASLVFTGDEGYLCGGWSDTRKGKQT